MVHVNVRMMWLCWLVSRQCWPVKQSRKVKVGNALPLLLLLPSMSPQCYLHNLLQLPPISTNHYSLSLWRYKGQGRRNQIQSQINSWAILAFFGFVLLTKLRYFVLYTSVLLFSKAFFNFALVLKQFFKIAILMQAQSRLRTGPLSMSADLANWTIIRIGWVCQTGGNFIIESVQNKSIYLHLIIVLKSSQQRNFWKNGIITVEGTLQ